MSLRCFGVSKCSQGNRLFIDVLLARGRASSEWRRTARGAGPRCDAGTAARGAAGPVSSGSCRKLLLVLPGRHEPQALRVRERLGRLQGDVLVHSAVAVVEPLGGDYLIVAGP